MPHVTIAWVLIVIGVICEACAAVGFPQTRVALEPLGLAFFMASFLVH